MLVWFRFSLEIGENAMGRECFVFRIFVVYVGSNGIGTKFVHSFVCLFVCSFETVLIEDIRHHVHLHNMFQTVFNRIPSFLGCSGGGVDRSVVLLLQGRHVREIRVPD